MASRSGPIKVLHVGLGPIGAASSGRSQRARASRSSAPSTSIRPRRPRPRRGRRPRPDAARQGLGRCEEGDQGGEARRRRAVHELVAEEGPAADRDDPEAEGADRLDDRGAGLSDEGATCATRARSTRSRRRRKVAVLGTGVNPGFVMDALPITLTGVCERVDAIRVDRVQDARIRRLPFQQKIGAGLTREQFQRKVDDGSVRHVGLAESISMIADALGLEARPDHRRDPAEDRRRRRSRASSSPSSRLGLRHHPGRRRLPQGRAGHHAAHGGLPRRAGVVRRGGDHRLARADDEDCRRRARRHRHGVDHGELDPEGPRRAARAAHDARHAAAVVLRRSAGGQRQDSAWRPQPPTLEEEPFPGDAQQPRGFFEVPVRCARARGGPASAPASRPRPAAADRGGARISGSLGAGAATVRREAWISGDSSAGVSVASRSASAHHAPDLVGQLADVARPGVEEQVFERLVADREPALLLFVAELAEVVLDERRDLLAAIAQRRQRAAGRR